MVSNSNDPSILGQTESGLPHSLERSNRNGIASRENRIGRTRQSKQESHCIEPAAFLVVVCLDQVIKVRCAAGLPKGPLIALQSANCGGSGLRTADVGNPEVALIDQVLSRQISHPFVIYSHKWDCRKPAIYENQRYPHGSEF